ncbi:MAG: T9SS type A sorting domain-containing protein [Candidatus Krumholzibacteriota bacterium]|nr:T9SS type A sorting domain-containing protein [Candidatus Krumholzibacteriota bacterium]
MKKLQLLERIGGLDWWEKTIAYFLAVFLLAGIFYTAPIAADDLGWASGGTTDDSGGCDADADITTNTFYTNHNGNITLYVDWDAYAVEYAKVRFRWYNGDVAIVSPTDCICNSDCFRSFQESYSFYVASGSKTYDMGLGIFVDTSEGDDFDCPANMIHRENITITRPKCTYAIYMNSISNKTILDTWVTVSGNVTDTDCYAPITDTAGNPVQVIMYRPIGSPVTANTTLNNGSYSVVLNLGGNTEIGTYTVMATYTPNSPPHPLTPASASTSRSFRRYVVSPVAIDIPSRKTFQDNFPGLAYDIESFIRADMAGDVNPPSSSLIIPGDSTTVSITPLEAPQLATTMDGRPKAFMHVNCTYIGPDYKPPLVGPSLQGTYGTFYSDDGDWTVIQGDSACIGSNPPVPNEYMFDLNDSLFTRGYRIEYYFEAEDSWGNVVRCPGGTGPGDEYLEWTCLPTFNSGILFVDDCDGILNFEEENYMQQTFEAVIPSSNMPDRFDINAGDQASNGLSSRAHLEHLKSVYRTIIWDSGNLRENTISDNLSEGEKDDDCALLKNWLDTSDRDVRLLVMGSNVATDIMHSQSGQELLLSCGVELVDSSYYEMTSEAGGIAIPYVESYYGSCMGGYTFYLYPSFGSINWFDVLDADYSIGFPAIIYPEFYGNYYSAGVQSLGQNSHGYDKRTMWLGFSLSQAIEPWPDGRVVRNNILGDILQYFGECVNADMTGNEETPLANRLSQCYPNPFNPATTLEFSIAEKGPVTLSVFNVAGQLVKTLVNDIREAGSHRVMWDGKNEAGRDVASGIFFCKIETAGFSDTKKMVLLR